MENQDINCVAIIGAGTQGAMIAYRCAVHSKTVNVYDLSEAMIEACKEKTANWTADQLKRKMITLQQAEAVKANITYMTSIEECCKNADLAIEVVPEKLQIKQNVWNVLDRNAPEHTLITSNSSSIRGSRIFTDVKRKDKTFSLNFGFPVEDDQVEVMWNGFTSEETKAKVKAFLRSLGNVYSITKKEIQGFSMNRIWRAVKKECLFLWANGYNDPETIDRAWMHDYGMNIGPFGLMDKVGLDVVLDIENSYYEDGKREEDKPPQKLVDMVASGKLGVKSGQGFYAYPNPAYTQEEWMRKVEE